jgi:transposase
VTVIGLDPHPQQHTAAALDDQGSILQVETFSSDARGAEAFLAWSEALGEYRVAVEGPSQPFFAAWLAGFTANGVPVMAVPAQKVKERRGRRKTDPHDAVLIARVLQAEPEIPPFQPPRWLQPVQELARTRSHLAQTLQAHRMRLRAAQTPAVRTSLERIVQAIEEELAGLERLIHNAVRALAPELLQLVGVGPVIAGVLLAETQDIARFQTADRYASYCGAAPVPWESGASKHVRVNTSGNRRLNRAIHLIARTRLRTDPMTKELVMRKEREGKTHREAIRVLKVYIARELYQILKSIAPQHRSVPAFT